MNYKESLEHLRSFVGYTLLGKYTKSDFEALEELINNYEAIFDLYNELLNRINHEELVKNIYGINPDDIKNIIEQVDFEYAKVISTELNKISDKLPNPILIRFTPEIVLNLCRDIGKISQMEEELELVEKAYDLYIRDHRLPPYDEENIKLTKLNYLNKAKKELENERH